MTPAIDHFMYVGTDLTALGAWFQHLSGVQASPGGQHLGVGIPLHTADAPYFHVRLGTPRGDVVLSSG